MRELAKKIGKGLLEFFSDEENFEEARYDPAHVAAMIVIVLFALTVLFWLLWALLVFGGGLQAKIVPFLSVLFTGRTFSDFGYVGYPYEMGIFEGWVTNVVALVLFIGAVIAVWYMFMTARDNK
jgi:preprotein translocase subunit Sec61beta